MKKGFTTFLSALKANTPPCKKGHPSRKFLPLFLILFLAVGNAWAETEIFSFTATSSTTTKGTYSATGGTAEIKGANFSTGGSNEITVGSQTFYKFSSSTEVKFTLTSGTFAVGDVISFTCACTTSNKTGKGVAIQTSPVITVTGDFPKNESNTISYTVAVNDGVAGESSFSIKRNDSDIKFGTVSVTRADAGGEPVCPETLTITSKDSKTAFLEGDAIELTAALSEGNGAITYQWYKGGTAEGNKLAGKTAAKLEIASCVEGDAGDYYCVASKSDCSDAVNADAFTITVTHNPCVTHHWFVATDDATANSKTNWSGFTNAPTGSKNQDNSVTIDGTTYTLKKRTDSTGKESTILGFTIPAGKVGTLYGYMKSSGSTGRTLSLKKDDDVIKTNTEITGSSWTLITIDAIAPGTYTLSPDQNVQVQMFVLKICDATFHTIAFDSDGGSSVAEQSVLDGTTAIQPTDPTWEHHRFDGWYNGATPYDWTANVTGDLTLTAHWTQLYTITYASGDGTATGDAPTQVDKAEGETFTVAANTFEVAGKDFVKWNDGANDYASGATYTVGTDNIVLTAQWKAQADKYTVKFMDGETVLDTKVVEVGSHPADIEHPTKPLYTFAAWQLSGSDVNLDEVSGTKDDIVILTARWTAAYALNVNFKEAATQDLGVETALNTYHYASDASDISFEEKGLKIKTNAARFYFNVAPGKVAEIKFGNISGATYSVDGGAAETLTSSQLKATYSASAQSCVMTMTTAAYNIVEKVTIHDPFTVKFDANGGDDVAAVQGKPSITLPEPTNGTMNFKGWYDAATEGNKIGDAGEEYTPTADVTIYAQWEAQSTINTLSDLKVNGETVLGFAANEHTYRMVLPYKSALPMITSATPTNANATFALWPVDGPEWTDEYDGGCYRQQVVVTPQDPTAEKGYYDIRITIAPKDGVSIIKVATTGGTNKTVTGLYAGDGDVNLSSNMKMDNGKYIGFTLAGTTLQAGDQINVHTTEASTTGDSHIIFYDNMTDKKELYETGEIGVVGDNIFTINAAMVGSASAYVYRANTDNAHQWNGYIDFIEVLRPMNPVLTAITFDGNAAEMGVGNTFSVTLQNGTDLNAMTVVPTIVKNGEGGSATPLVAWAWGENTYRVTDKDGDYTDYTITLTEAASPSAAPVITTQPADGNYIEGETITALKVVATGSGELSYQWYLGAEAIDGATAATYTPTVDAIGLYVYHCVVTNTEAGHPATSLVSSDATITIAEDPAAIKLLNNAGAINTTDFITGVSATTVNFNDAVHNCATFGSTASTVVGASGLNKYIIYNSKTTQTKIKFVLYNVQNASVTMKLQKLVEGGTEMEEVVINVPSKEVFTTDFYTFDGSANRTMYAFVQNTGIKVLQVKVIDNGTPLKQFGEVGYSINFNKGRLFLASGNEIAYDGLTYNASSNYAPLNNEGLSLASSKSYRFEVPADVTMTVTAANNKKYYITDKEDGSDNETAAAEARSFDLTAGAWYLRVDGSNLGLTKIEFTAPKCEVPVFNALANSDICSGESYVPLNGTAIVSDGGIVTYKWYAEGGTEVLAETATYTPSADGSYYVVATNSLAGHTDNVATSEIVTVTTHTSAAITAAPENVRQDVGTNATLTVVATGKNLAYQWQVCSETGVVTDATVLGTEATLDVTVGTGVQYYKVVVSSDCGIPVEAVVKVEEWTELPQANVTGSITWDFSTTVAGSTTLENQTDVVLANMPGINNNANFNSQALKGSFNKLPGNYFQGSKLSFTTEVAGKLTITFRGTNDHARHLQVCVGDGETVVADWNYNNSSTSQTKTVFVPAGKVTLKAFEGEDAQNARIYNMIFNATPDYIRDVRQGYYGTICLPNGGVMVGAAVYEIAYMDYKDSAPYKIYFDVILNGKMEAGVPYIFLPNEGADKLAVFYTDEANESAKNANGLYGFIGTSATDEYQIPGGVGNYIIQNNQYREVLAGADARIVSNRAYIKLSEVPGYNDPLYVAPEPAPGRKRVAMGTTGAQVATGVDQVQGDEVPTKMIINGQLFILRGEKMYDAQGKLVR